LIHGTDFLIFVTTVPSALRITYKLKPKPLNFNLFMPPNLILCPEWIATQAPIGQVLHNHAIAIDAKGKIHEVAPQETLLTKFPNVEKIDLTGHLVTPGLINLHTHASMSLLRGHGDDLPLDRWLKERIWPLEAQLLSSDFVFDGAVLAGAEMLLGGTTCFNDMYFWQDAVGRAALSLGMRANLSVGILDFPTAYANDAKEHLSKGLAVRDLFRGESTLGFSLAPHAPYTVSDATFSTLVTLSQELGISLHTHIHETAQEIANSVNQYGARPLARLKALGVLDGPLVAAHCVHLLEAEIELLAKYGVHVAHCPHSNLKLASGIAPIALLLNAGVNIGIGTDGSASNNRLDLHGETRTAALLAKGISGDAACFNAHEALAASTINAANALGLGELIGSIEIGKAADLVSWNFNDFNLTPVIDPVAQWLYSAGREHVADVWVNGQLVVRKRQLVGSTPQRTLSEVTARIPVWHNLVGRILSVSA
jgi:5-methylthioadenosine/S-adenosylhomocysteine deaminase